MRFILTMRGYMRFCMHRYVIAFIALQVVALLNLLPPWFIGRIIDAMTTHTLTAPFLTVHLLGMIAAALAMYGLRYLWNSQLYGAAIEIARRIRSDLFAHLTRLSPSFYQKYSTGDLMAHATNDLNAVEQAVGSGIMTLVDSLIAGFTVIFGMIFLVSGKLTAVALLPFPLLIWVTRRYSAAMHTRFSRAQHAFSNLTESVRETVAGIRAVRAHGIAQRQHNHFHSELNETLDANTDVAKIDALFSPTIQLIYGASFVLSLLYGAFLIESGSLTVGLFTSFTLYLAQLLGPFLQFGWQFNVFQRGNTAWLRLKKIFATQPEVQPGHQTLRTNAKLNLEVKIDAFTYPNATHPALQSVQFHLPQGGFLGLTGPTGSGKSTLMALLLRQYHLSEGTSDIKLAGQSMAQLTFETLHGKMAWVPQQPQLFSGSIADNIALGKPNASIREITFAAEIAGIKDEIYAMKAGFLSEVIDDGANFSGGQKQRIALARALLTDADILLLDDPLSALDMKTEALVRRNLRQYVHHKSIILVTQRLMNLRDADDILVLNQGQVMERGKHSELIAMQGWYATVFQRQTMDIKQHTAALHDHKAAYTAPLSQKA
ncbi:putative multidrug resistance ABC transporter ATP-binding/permease protein YheI [Vibrio stylophorae]|uniref:Multidrug resistance ABC transporter ATP-binding/permease protein YheI n=1 Tax=Vibrio stylophorae TaxID=659351 RepID=A0ABM8ZY95_9VIBR|nr:ABC transporter transmembrane domain-containing protein [Vibrio stylophorae]CAH0535794.1 putative multidrug resistance ABC transporter ATP-binding/permease protein YheI [Vibrio stylophorae]